MSKSCRKVDGQRGGEEQASQIACEGREIDKGYTLLREEGKAAWRRRRRARAAYKILFFYGGRLYIEKR